METPTESSLKHSEKMFILHFQYRYVCKFQVWN